METLSCGGAENKNKQRAEHNKQQTELSCLRLTCSAVVWLFLVSRQFVWLMKRKLNYYNLLAVSRREIEFRFATVSCQRILSTSIGCKNVGKSRKLYQNFCLKKQLKIQSFKDDNSNFWSL